MPLSNFVPRGFGVVHHSIAILDHEVPNPNLTIRNFFIAVGGGKLLAAVLRAVTQPAVPSARKHARMLHRRRKRGGGDPPGNPGWVSSETRVGSKGPLETPVGFQGPA